MVAFDMDGKVRKPKFELDSEQVRYEHRFAPFNSVMTPPPVHYLQFKVSLLGGTASPSAGRHAREVVFTTNPSCWASGTSAKIAVLMVSEVFGLVDHMSSLCLHH